MKEYVAGFLFNNFGSYVALVKKIKGPSSVVGKWNAIGGKVEPGEEPLTAMDREFFEEAGVPGVLWEEFASLSGGSKSEAWRVRFYVAFDSASLALVKQMEEEEIKVFELPYLAIQQVAENLRWLVPMALSFQKYPTAYAVYES